MMLLAGCRKSSTHQHVYMQQQKGKYKVEEKNWATTNQIFKELFTSFNTYVVVGRTILYQLHVNYLIWRLGFFCASMCTLHQLDAIQRGNGTTANTSYLAYDY